MEFQESGFFSSDANLTFGRSSPPLGSYWLESTLRYIAAKKCGSNVAELKPITVYTCDFTSHMTGDEYINSFNKEFRNDINIFYVPVSAAMPVIETTGWQALNQAPFPVSNFLSQICPTNIYINTEKQRVVVFVKQYTDAWVQAFTSSLMRILQWLYPDNNCSKEDKLLFKLIHEADKDSFIELLEKAVKAIDFRTWRIQRDLHGWNNSYRNTRIALLQSSVGIQQSSIEKLEANLADNYTKFENTKVELESLLSTSAKDDSELADFFCCRKHLNILEIKNSNDGNRLLYSIIETIDYYDQDAFNNTYGKTGSYMYYSTIAQETREIFYAIFAQHKGRLRTQACFELQNTSALNAKSIDTAAAYYSTIPHPHLGYGACLGQNANYIKEYMQKGDWDLAIEQSVAAAKNIHFGDSGVVKGFMEKFKSDHYDTPCIIMPNGEVMTPRAFYETIKSKNEEEY